MKKLIFGFFVAVLASAGSAYGSTVVSSSYQVTANVVNECAFISTPAITFNTISIPVGSFATQVVTWKVRCASPGYFTIYPDSIGNASQWVFNNGYGKNVSTNSGTIYLSMTIDGTPFSAFGNTLYNSGTDQYLSIEARLTPSGAYTGNVAQTNNASIAF